MFHGIDVSDDQAAIDWKAVAAHAACAYVQIGFGTAAGVVATQTGAQNVQGALAQGLVTGVYFFAYPLPGNAAQQGAWAGATLRAMQRAGADFALPLALDAEVNPSQMEPAALSGWVEEWLAATGIDAKDLAVYSDPGFWNAAADGRPVNAHAWVASYGASSAPRLNGLPAPFMWQTTDKGRLPGIAAPVDLDTLFWVPNPQAPIGGEGTVGWTVRPGETLSDIVGRYMPAGTGASAAAKACGRVASLNGLRYPVALAAGRVLKIPQPL